jgi:hypothetical protein
LEQAAKRNFGGFLEVIPFSHRRRRMDLPHQFPASRIPMELFPGKSGDTGAAEDQALKKPSSNLKTVFIIHHRNYSSPR